MSNERPNGNHLDLSVSVRLSAAALARVNEWQASFTQVSRLLSYATDGGRGFRTIWVCNSCTGGLTPSLGCLSGTAAGRRRSSIRRCGRPRT